MLGGDRLSPGSGTTCVRSLIVNSHSDGMTTEMRCMFTKVGDYMGLPS